jgi:hypothetical protein
MSRVIFSIHDTWVKGSATGDVDDLAAIFYLAKRCRNDTVIIYIINDAALNGKRFSKLESFNKEYGNKLRELCPKLILYGMTGDILENGSVIPKNKEELVKYSKNDSEKEEDTAIESMSKYLKKANPVIICAPINSERDPQLHAFFENNKIENLYGQSNFINGYNFSKGAPSLCDLTIERTNLTIGKQNNKIKLYETNHVNRRLTSDQLEIIVDDPDIVLMMMKYGILKTVFFPIEHFIMGLYVSNDEFLEDIKNKVDDDDIEVLNEDESSKGSGASTGNNATGLIIFNNPNKDNSTTKTNIQRPHSEIQKYFTDKKINYIETLKDYDFVNVFTNEIIEKARAFRGPHKYQPEIEKRFKYAMAYMAVCMKKWFSETITNRHDLGTFSVTPQYDEFNPIERSKVDITSPMWDLIAIHYILDEISVEKQNVLVFKNELLVDTDKQADTAVWKYIESAIQTELKPSTIVSNASPNAPTPSPSVPTPSPNAPTPSPSVPNSSPSVPNSSIVQKARPTRFMVRKQLNQERIAAEKALANEAAKEAAKEFAKKVPGTSMGGYTKKRKLKTRNKRMRHTRR